MGLQLPHIFFMYSLPYKENPDQLYKFSKLLHNLCHQHFPNILRELKGVEKQSEQFHQDSICNRWTKCISGWKG